MALSEGTRAIIKEVAREVMCEYKSSLKADTDAKIHLHSVECEAKKFGKVKSFLSADGGGVIVAVISWFLKKQ